MNLIPRRAARRALCQRDRGHEHRHIRNQRRRTGSRIFWQTIAGGFLTLPPQELQRIADLMKLRARTEIPKCETSTLITVNNQTTELVQTAAHPSPLRRVIRNANHLANNPCLRGIEIYANQVVFNCKKWNPEFTPVERPDLGRHRSLFDHIETNIIISKRHQQASDGHRIPKRTKMPITERSSPQRFEKREYILGQFPSRDRNTVGHFSISRLEVSRSRQQRHKSLKITS